ncbi:MAG TPA: hypothetical protein ENI85_08400 [Deltaproteobacteria bacterium]|nr:hypothetical protein [Deltaproteobacteria bacterium]
MTTLRLGALLLVTLASIPHGACAARGTAPPIVEAAGPALPLQNGDEIHVATANLWGVSVLGFDWAEKVDVRFAEMAERLARNEPRLDVVLIQEAWKDSARHALLRHEGVIRNFPFRVDAVEQPGGAGLVVLSRFPIEAARFHRFQAQGNCLKFWEADCLAGKGILAVRVRIGDRSLWIGNTHLIACYSDDDAGDEACDEGDPNGGTRRAQLIEARRFIESLAKTGSILLGGDFNFTRSSRDYPAMVHPPLSSTSSASPTREARSDWSEAGRGTTRAGRIDYLWTRGGSDEAWRVVSPASPIFTAPVRLAPSSSPARTDDRGSVIDRKGSIPLSDHPVIMAAFCLVRVAVPGDDCLAFASGSTPE